ncbi:DUF2435 domain containing protein [Trichuris trichiura]|uniref:DUF2435 domain containing protein n=1 Tax=Trichuris trichiura TaxID=36087 RepID=A0A077ZBC6_TRITR|nr:DUF2435 domain containing protein [Trichuris trichiura]
MAESPLLFQEDIVSALSRLINFRNVSAGQQLDAVLVERTASTLELVPTAFEGCAGDNIRGTFLKAVKRLIGKYMALQISVEQISKDHMKILLKVVEVVIAIGCDLSLEPKISKALFGRDKWSSLENIQCEREQLEPVATERLQYTGRFLIKLVNQPKLHDELMRNFGDCIVGVFAWLGTVQRRDELSFCEFQGLLDDCSMPLCVKNLFSLITRLKNVGLSASDPLILSTGNLLTSTLLRSGGLLSFIRAFGLTAEDGRSNRMAKLAAVIIRCPQSFRNKPSEYYNNILEQCIAIFRRDSIDEAFKSACYVILSELYKSPYKAYINLLGSLIWGPLLEKCQLAIEKPDACSSVEADKLTDVVKNVHRLFANSNHELFPLLDPFVDFLLSAYVDIRFSNSTCSQQVSELLWFYFEKRNASSVCNAIVKWLKKEDDSTGSAVYLRFDVTDDGKLVAKISSQPPDQDCIMSVNVLLCKVSAAAGANLFFALLPILCMTTVQVENSGTIDPSAKVVVALSSTVEALLDKFSTKIFAESRRLLDVCRTLLESAMQSDFLVTESCVSTVLGILEVAISFSGADDAYSFCRIRPMVEKLAATYHNSELRLKASQLLNNIDERASSSLPTESDEVSGSFQAENGETYEDALHFLKLSNPEYVGHGLILLKRLIVCKDEKTLKNMNDVLTLTTAHLQNDDSYIYLSAIAVLVCASRYDLSLLSEKMIGIFVNFVSSSQIDSAVKVAEAISLIGKSLGDLAPHYIDVVVPPMLSVYLSAEDFYLRASCLVTIGSVMREGQFKVSSFLIEMLHVIERAINAEEHSMVVSGALHLLQCLLQGCGDRLLSIFGDSILPVYRHLKSIYSNHRREEVHRLHAQLCLEQINVAMKRNLRLNVD